MSEQSDKYLADGDRDEVRECFCCSGCSTRFGFDDLGLKVLRTKVGEDVYFLCASRTYLGGRLGCGTQGNDNGYEKPTDKPARDDKVLLHCPHSYTTGRGGDAYENIPLDQVPERFFIDADQWKRPRDES
ncbi:MAG: hypothetical protein QF809_03635 [Candidatus Peribacteraceae bacterium]|mgnify:CR=1 FL=1|jgi:hypothetical protein|nr:hypothetical protein [Candidatus Peribacteraceae bacterium]MDP7646036.1 hypothetical protein [Candidatus Peribacteraceae bacterium]